MVAAGILKSKVMKEDDDNFALKIIFLLASLWWEFEPEENKEKIKNQVREIIEEYKKQSDG